MLDGTKRVLENFDNDEFEIFILQGKNGYGKTTYANRIIAEVYSIRETKKWGGNERNANWNIKLFKNHLGFHPLHVYNKWIKMKKRDYVFHWDDAGTWLHSLDYQDTFVKNVGKYLQTARTDWACIIFSAIDMNDIVNKIRNFKSCVIIDITKEGTRSKESTNFPSRLNLRTATAWHYWHDRHNKQGSENDWQEPFNCHVPDDFYKWYYPLRVKYARMSKRLGLEELMKKKEIMQTKNIIKM